MTPAPSSFFQLGVPAPGEAGQAQEGEQLPQASDIPWKALVPDGLPAPKGMALQQLLSMCPEHLRGAMVQGVAGQKDQASRPGPTPAQGPAARGKAQTAPPPSARVLSLAACRKALAAGEALIPFPMTPAASEQALFIGLCRDSEPGRALLAQLFSQEAREGLAAFHLLPTVPTSLPSDSLYGSLGALYANSPLLANAFEHTRQELEALCLDGFIRQADPVETLLRLR